MLPSYHDRMRWRIPTMKPRGGSTCHRSRGLIKIFSSHRHDIEIAVRPMDRAMKK
jgi:hypothetical protein